MIIYNTTFHINGEQHISKFLTYIRDIYYPSVREYEQLKNPRFVRLLTDLGEGITGYAIMFEVEDINGLKKWKTGKGKDLEVDFRKTFGHDIITFSTAMKEHIIGD